MKKKQKACIQKDLKLLEQAHHRIEKLIKHHDFVSAAHLLEQCQTASIQIGSHIEDSEGVGTTTVSLLEEYCEELYQMHKEVLEKATSRSCEDTEAYRRLHQLLEQIEASVNRDIKIRIEMLFLPYKASMWDSLESVWKTAEEDPDCDAYVIPLPYYDKNPDGSFGKMHYEGEQFPTYVPITKYDAYDLKKRRPDVIFIHNPYDEQNLVTSVHPLFYSESLKQYTEDLVYIPYYILREFSINNKEAIAQFERFCTVPGVVNANQVIVQSEHMRQIYIDIMMGYTNECKRSYWEKKILGFGSPKIDKVINTKKEDLDIPPQWLKVIQKPDGSWKKIILYNTSIDALLKHNEKMLHKIEDVFKLFTEFQDDIVLLWRPHPLSQTTIKSMRPQLIDLYQDLLRYYIGENGSSALSQTKQSNKIYDDTADLHRAIKLSDAYVGDSSSLVALYQTTGKPIMIQNTSILNTTGFERIICPCIVFEDEDFIWMSETAFAAIYKYNKTTTNIEQTFYFNTDINLQGYYFHRAVESNNKIYFSPLRSKQIGVFDKKSGDFSYIPFDDSFNGLAFWSAFAFEENIYFVPMEYPAIMKLNILTLEVSFITDLVDQLCRLKNYFDTDFICTQGIQVNNDSFAAASARANAVVVFNMRSEESTVYEVGEKEWRYIDICFDGECYWLLPRLNTPIVKWNPITNETNIFSKFICDLADNKAWFSYIEYFNAQIWVLPKIADFAITINPANGEMRIVEEIKNIFGYREDASAKTTCVTSWTNNSSMYLYDAKYGELIQIGKKNITKTKILPPQNIQWLEKYRKSQHTQISLYIDSILKYRNEHMSEFEIDLLHKSVQIEREKISLEHFIELEVINYLNKSNTEDTNNYSAGQEIYNCLKAKIEGEL